VEGVSHNNHIFYDYLLDDGCIWVLQQNIPKNNIQQLIVQNVEQVHLEYKCSA
jgi:predicted nuclease of predicted toxin-antitoxin system